MATRDEIHKLIERLPEDQLEKAREYIESLSPVDEEPLSAETQAAVEEGLDDIRRGDTMGLQQYRRSRGL